MNDYFLVVKLIKDGSNLFPKFYNCALVDDKFIEIKDIVDYVKNGEGLTDNVIEAYGSFKINEFNRNWDKNISLYYQTK